MARILSSPWSIIRGSIAGTTYLAGPQHQIIARARTAPVQPGTPMQALIRAALSAAAFQWQTMSAIQRQSWQFYASSCIFTGPLGNYTVSGRAIFMAAYALANYINTRGLDVIALGTNPPVITGFIKLADVRTTNPPAGVTGLTVRWTNNDPDEVSVFVELSGPQSPTRNFWKGPWDTNNVAAITTGSTLAGFISFGSLTPGQAYFARVRAVTTAQPLRESTEFFLRHIAAVGV